MQPVPLHQPYDHAVACLAAAGGDVSALPVPLQTLLIVESAQTIIDAGGLEFFFDADFPNNPPYADFVDAYRRIGADAAADCIEAAALLFPFADPQYFEPLRQLWLEKLQAEPDGEFTRLSLRVSGDARVWEQLADYVRRNAAAFRGA